jgi:hypothetical protein
MRRFMVVALLLALALAAVFSSQASAAEAAKKPVECSDGGAITGTGFGFMVSAPSGWCFFFKDKSDKDVMGGLVPEGLEPGDSPISIRLRVAFKQDVTLGKVMENELNRFREKYGPASEARPGPDIPFAVKGTARTLEFLAGPQGPRTMVAIAEWNTVYIVLAYSGDDEEIYSWRRDAFLKIAKDNLIPMQ